jgi:succinate dehydrogenase / fumarate reductase, iron-sulfur subunit
MNLTLKIWRQKNADAKGKVVTYQVSDISEDMSFLEMMDVLNEQLINKGDEPVAFDHDCREGICGSCNLQINGEPHGPDRGVTTCQLHMRRFKDGDTIVIEPFRAKAFPVIKDLVVDRSSFDRIQQAGGYISTQLPVLDVEPVLRHVRMPVQCFSPQQKLASLLCFRKVKLKQIAGFYKW